MEGAWWPLRGQVSVDGRIQLGWKVANLYAELHGRVQLGDPDNNPLCALSPLDSRLGCKSWCSWSPGQGELEATVGWTFLVFGSSGTMQLLSDPVECRPPPSVPSVTTSGAGSSSSGSSSSSCSATVLYDTDLTYGDLPGQGAVDVADWEECCNLCLNNSACFAW